MKKYDKIYFPDEKGDFKVQEFYEDYHEWSDMPIDGICAEKNNVIVLTIEELREVWEAGKNRGTEAHSGVNPYPNFKTYLTSKGITI